MTPAEPRNPFYLLLLLACFLFVITALAIAVVPMLEEKARQAGAEVPPSEFRDALRSSQGLWWLGYEAVAIVLFSLLSMGLDRLRTLQKERARGTIPPAGDDSTSHQTASTGKPCPPADNVPTNSGG